MDNNDANYDVNTIAARESKKPIGIPNLAIARESLFNAEKLFKQYGYSNLALVQILVGHRSAALSSLWFYSGENNVGSFTMVYSTHAGCDDYRHINLVKLECVDTEPLLRAIEQVDDVVRKFTDSPAPILPRFVNAPRVKLVFGKDIDLTLWDERRILIAARVQLLLSHMNVVIDEVNREIVS